MPNQTWKLYFISMCNVLQLNPDLRKWTSDPQLDFYDSKMFSVLNLQAISLGKLLHSSPFSASSSPTVVPCVLSTWGTVAS